jgi:hypothetical protein
MACFLIGLILSALSLFVGLFNIHIPGFESLHHMHPHGFHLHLHLDSLPQGNLPGISPFNFSTLMAFLAWFGGAGYLLTIWGKLGVFVVGGISMVAGATGGMIVFLFLAKVLMRGDGTLFVADYHMEGLLVAATEQGRSFFRNKAFAALAAPAVKTVPRYPRVRRSSSRVMTRASLTSASGTRWRRKPASPRPDGREFE